MSPIKRFLYSIIFILFSSYNIIFVCSWLDRSNSGTDESFSEILMTKSVKKNTSAYCVVSHPSALSYAYTKFSAVTSTLRI